MALQDKLIGNTTRGAAIGGAADLAASLATIIVALAVVTTIGMRYLWPGGPADREPDVAAMAVGSEVSLGRHVKTNPQATVAIVEFSDFECRFCRLYARDQYHVVMKELVDTGLADYAFRHLPLDVIHPRAFAAGVAAECAGEQGRFWDMHDVLFRQTLSDEEIRKQATGVGLDGAAFDACLRRDGRGPILGDLEDAKRLGVAGTPTFLVGVKRPEGQIKVTHVLLGAQGVSALKAAVEAAMKAT
jgi:protein-disulfide isomerase